MAPSTTATLIAAIEERAMTSTGRTTEGTGNTSSSPKIFTASSLLFREWLIQEVAKRTPAPASSTEPSVPRPKERQEKRSRARRLNNGKVSQ